MPSIAGRNTPRTLFRSWIGCLVGLVAYAPPARAEPSLPSLSLDSGALAPPSLALGALIRPPIAPAGRVVGREMSGAFLGVDGGWSVALPSQTDPSTGAWGFGVRVGYAWRSGLSLQARYDDLGVHPTLGDVTATPLQIGSVGVRYAVPLVLLPFGEALVGAAFDGADPRFTAGAGIGLAIPLARHVEVEGVVRDWFAPARLELRQVVVFRLGLTVGFGS